MLGMKAMSGNRKRVPKRRFRTGGTIIFAGLLVLLVAELTGCADPDSAILARLSESEVAQFRSGQKVAVADYYYVINFNSERDPITGTVTVKY